MKKHGWEAGLRKTIELWKYQSGDDVLASALADEVIADVKDLLATVRAEGFLEGEKRGISIGQQIAIDNMKRRPTKSGTYGAMNNSDALKGGGK